MSQMSRVQRASASVLETSDVGGRSASGARRHDGLRGRETLHHVGLDAARAARDRAVDALFALQSPQGWWKGELQTNVTMDAEDLFLRHFLGISEPSITRAAANWIRSQQREDGTWATFFGGPPELSTTVEAYWALKLAGDDPGAEHMRRAAGYIVDAGGLERTRVFTRIWMALFGLWSWDELPALPPEVILLPPRVLGRRVPLNIYDFACWARQTVVPLTVVGSFRPVRPMPLSLDELRTGARRKEAEPRPHGSLGRRFQQLDRILHWHERHPIGPLRALARRRAGRWILERQEADGGWGGIQPPWVYSLLALHLLGYPLDHPAMARALAGLDGFTIWDHSKCGPGSPCAQRASASVPEFDRSSERSASGASVEPACVAAERRLEACQSPVWDTALAIVALRDAGVPASDERLVRATEWMLGEEIGVTGDWAVQRPHLAPGGWAFEFANDHYPDIDDTAEVVLALERMRDVDPVRIGAAIDRGVRWVNGMQCGNGGFAAFDADNDSRVVTQLPFCDFGAVTDPPSADVTAHVVEMFGHLRRHGNDAAVDATIERRAVDWLSAEQEHDGSWFGRWGANHLYGTGAAVPALVAAGVPTEDSRVEGGVRWLDAVQHGDGGWGEDLRSYLAPPDGDVWRGRGESTPSQTAWALLAQLSAHRLGEATRRGITWLVEHQRADGSWDEPHFTGTGFPRDFYINYHLYRLVFPVTALGRYVAALEEGAA